MTYKEDSSEPGGLLFPSECGAIVSVATINNPELTAKNPSLVDYIPELGVLSSEEFLAVRGS